MTSIRFSLSAKGHGIMLVAGALLAATTSLSAGSGITPQPKAGDAIDGLTGDQLARFFLGRTAFDHVFTPAEGLGPVFNQDSCGSCHNQPFGGSGGVTVTRFGFYDWNDGTFDPLEALGGSLLQAEAIAIPGYPIDYCREVVPDEETANIVSFRVTNSALGMGLVEAIPDSEIAANEAISGGSVHWVIPLEDDSKEPTPRAGRFGWKAQVATTLTFSADAALNEMGITNRLLPDPIAPNNDIARMAVCDSLGPAHPQDQPDAQGFDFIDRVTDFQRFLAPPPQTPRFGMTGEGIFEAIGCGSCHRASYVTANDPKLEEALRNRQIRPYSDFLLHNMGMLGDFIEQGDAGIFEFRTPSLWGLRLRDPLLHDGRVGGGTFHNRIVQAVQWHDVPGSAARIPAQNFLNLPAAERDAVVAFLDSLGRREFDADGDDNIDDADFQALLACYTGPEETYSGGVIADHPCAVFDVNLDGSIDETDFAVFLMVYEGGQEHCDLWNALAAAVEPIAVDVPKECLAQPSCEGDLNGDDVVDVLDLLVLLDDWGPCAGCNSDLNGDDVVDVLDLLILLDAWGPCP
jgi:CxxC motif-containing protein (DUF1111 family)